MRGGQGLGLWGGGGVRGSLKGVMSPQVWQDRSDRNLRMPQELQRCTLLGLQGGRSRPCSQEEGQNGGCASGQRGSRDPGLDSKVKGPEGQEDSVEEGRHGLCKDSGPR